MTARSENGGNERSIVILDPDDGSPVIVIVPPAAPAKSDKALPGDASSAPPADKK